MVFTMNGMRSDSKEYAEYMKKYRKKRDGQIKKKQWFVAWDEKAALHNAKIYKSIMEGDTEVWKIMNKSRPESTWRAFVIKSSTIDITSCRDPHFYDMATDIDNWERIK